MIYRLGFLYFFFLLLHTPSKAGIVIHNGLTHVYNMNHAGVYKGRISLENTSKRSQIVKVYLQDISYKWSGEIYYTTPPSHPFSNAAWITLGGTLLTLQAGEKMDIPYEINVPNEQLASGSYWSVIIVEPEQNIDSPKDNNSIAISSVVRYAIQVISNYKSDELQPHLKFESVKMDTTQQKKILKVAILNDGSLFCKPTASIDIYDNKTGQIVGTYSSVTMSLLPNNSKSFLIDISSVPKGKYATVIIATDENENAFALNVELEVKND